MRYPHVTRALVDLDGVLCDFVSGVCDLHDRENPYDDPGNLGVYEFSKLWGMTPEEFYGPTRSREFWANLVPYGDAGETMRLLSGWLGPENVAILTSLANAEAAAGKYDWVARHFPDYLGRLMVARCKHFCAHPRAMLLDDDPRNCERFRAWGGTAVVVPRPWNSRTPEMISVAEGLRELLKG